MYSETIEGFTKLAERKITALRLYFPLDLLMRQIAVDVPVAAAR